MSVQKVIKKLQIDNLMENDDRSSRKKHLLGLPADVSLSLVGYSFDRPIRPARSPYVLTIAYLSRHFNNCTDFIYQNHFFMDECFLVSRIIAFSISLSSRGVRRVSIITHFACLEALRNCFSIVDLDAPVGLFISHWAPSIMMSAVFRR